MSYFDSKIKELISELPKEMSVSDIDHAAIEILDTLTISQRESLLNASDFVTDPDPKPVGYGAIILLILGTLDTGMFPNEFDVFASVDYEDYMVREQANMISETYRCNDEDARYFLVKVHERQGEKVTTVDVIVKTRAGKQDISVIEAGAASCAFGYDMTVTNSYGDAHFEFDCGDIFEPISSRELPYSVIATLTGYTSITFVHFDELNMDLINEFLALKSKATA
jgi:hypothetical protein